MASTSGTAGTTLGSRAGRGRATWLAITTGAKASTGTGGTSSRTSRAAWPSPTWLELGRHCLLFVQLRYRQNQQAFFAVAGLNNFAVLASFQRAFQLV